MYEDTRIEPGMAEEMRRIAEGEGKSGEEGEPTARFTEKERTAVDETKNVRLPDDVAEARAANERDREVVLRIKSEFEEIKQLAADIAAGVKKTEDGEMAFTAAAESVAEFDGVDPLGKVRELLGKMDFTGMNDRQIHHVRKMLDRTIRDLLVHRSGLAFRKRTEALHFGATAPEEAQAQYEREDAEINQLYDRWAMLKEFDDLVASARGEGA